MEVGHKMGNGSSKKPILGNRTNLKKFSRKGRNFRNFRIGYTDENATNTNDACKNVAATI